MPPAKAEQLSHPAQSTSNQSAWDVMLQIARMFADALECSQSHSEGRTCRHGILCGRLIGRTTPLAVPSVRPSVCPVQTPNSKTKCV